MQTPKLPICIQLVLNSLSERTEYEILKFHIDLPRFVAQDYFRKSRGARLNPLLSPLPRKFRSESRDSNPGPQRPERCALPTALLSEILRGERGGLPMTYAPLVSLPGIDNFVTKIGYFPGFNSASLYTFAALCR